MKTDTASLEAVVRALAELREMERTLLERRAVLVRQAMDRHGWKRVARILGGIGQSRVYAMAQGQHRS